jgi:hypothetical protein
MKNLFTLIIASLVASASFSQKIDGTKVPDAVQQGLKNKYNNAQNLLWEKVDSVYAATFIMDETNTRAEFSAKGTWMSTKWDFPMEYTPQAIKDYIAKNYAGYKLKETSVDEFPSDGKVYVTRINKKKECMDVYFTLRNEFKKDEKLICDKNGKCCKDTKACDKPVDKPADKPADTKPLTK